MREILKQKTILIISPQAWGTMFVSKHHYAIELAKYGNIVYFLNPPTSTKRGSIIITPFESQPGLFIIDHRLWFPYNLKFHAIGLFHRLMHFHIKKLLKIINKKIDIIWSFDLGNIYDLDSFPRNSLKLFHPVDEPLNKTALDSGIKSEVIFSVTREILEKYEPYHIPSFVINHGVTETFLGIGLKNGIEGTPVRVGFSGNLLRNDLDRPVLLDIISNNPGCIFEFWGSYNAKQANVGGDEDEAATKFINQLKSNPNVVLHGAVSSKTLAAGLADMDVFLICYDINKDQSKGTNYHKIMEFLALGQVIVSNNVTAYKERPDLVMMNMERNDNNKLPDLFKKVITNLEYFNSPEMVENRRSFARQNTYHSQIIRIEEILSKMGRL
ncbi:hypothetical protein MD537_04515 [Flavihumibacter sediminis]|nr:hypothetical protein [Flavihumibacter sediminis]